MYLPWNVSLMAMAAAEAILDTGEVKEKVKYNNDWMETFAEELKAEGLKPFPPHGNYMLVDASRDRQDAAARSSQAARDMEQVIIKTIKPINGKEGYFRVTPGTPEESERFVRVRSRATSPSPSDDARTHVSAVARSAHALPRIDGGGHARLWDDQAE